jgi:hypothetical protein
MFRFGRELRCGAKSFFAVCSGHDFSEYRKRDPAAGNAHDTAQTLLNERKGDAVLRRLVGNPL